MSLEYRKALPNQISLVREMIKKYWLEIERKYPDPKTWQLCLENIDHTLAYYYPFFQPDCALSDIDSFYFIYLDKKIIGCISLEVNKDISEQFICDLMIEAEFQGRGYGSDALKFATELAKKSALSQVGLWVDKKNLVARHVYQKAGFVFVEPVKLNWVDQNGVVVGQTDSEYMIKKLV